jgi:hypothetical protein
MTTKTMRRNVAFDLRLPQRPLSPPTPNSSLSDRHSAATIGFLAHTSRTGHKLMDSNEDNTAQCRVSFMFQWFIAF